MRSKPRNNVGLIFFGNRLRFRKNSVPEGGAFLPVSRRYSFANSERSGKLLGKSKRFDFSGINTQDKSDEQLLLLLSRIPVANSATRSFPPLHRLGRRVWIPGRGENMIVSLLDERLPAAVYTGLLPLVFCTGPLFNPTD